MKCVTLNIMLRLVEMINLPFTRHVVVEREYFIFRIYTTLDNNFEIIRLIYSTINMSKIQVFLGVTLCIWASNYRRFEASWRQLQS